VKRVAALVALRGLIAPGCARTSCFELQKLAGVACWPHRSAPTGPEGRIDRKVDGDVNGGLVQGVELSVPQEIGTEAGAEGEAGIAGAGRGDVGRCCS
jgi:hypothetical protein